MILGLSISNFTTFHVILSLIGIASGLVVAHAMLSARETPGWTALFLVTTLLTTVTGFLFPISVFTPALGVGIVSLVVLIPAIAARYLFGGRGIWRPIYVVGAVAALYLNCFVAVVQAFLKIPVLQPLAPNQSEPPFVIAQAVVLVLFVAIGILALVRYRPGLPAVA